MRIEPRWAENIPPRTVGRKAGTACMYRYCCSCVRKALRLRQLYAGILNGAPLLSFRSLSAWQWTVVKSALAELAGGIMGKASNCVSMVTVLLVVVRSPRSTNQGPGWYRASAVHGRRNEQSSRTSAASKARKQWAHALLIQVFSATW